MLLPSAPTLLHRVASTSVAVSGAPARNDKVRLIAETLADLEPPEIAPTVAFLSGEIRQGRIGIGWATAARLTGHPANEPTLTVTELNQVFKTLAHISGPGSVAARNEVLGDLLARATEVEIDFIRKLIVGEIRQGALAGVVTAAIVAASRLRAERGVGQAVNLAALRRAAMLLGDLPATAELALGAFGPAALAAVGLEVGRGIEPMLATTSSGPAEALADVGVGTGTGTESGSESGSGSGSDLRASVEWKLDGIRVQVHRRGQFVRVFTRNLNDITERFPAVVEVARSLPVESVILDGEVLGVTEDEMPQAFQDTMAGVGRTRVSFFDVLHVDGLDLIDEPLSTRSAELDRIAGAHRIPAVSTADPERANAVLAEALAQGHEGIMVKALDSRYDAGRRGKTWRKVKPVYTYDLVVIGVERGNGRRKGTLSNLHLGARDPETGAFVMVGKTFKGLTDELLAWQTDALSALAISDDGYTVTVRPELVVEIAIDGVQRSTRYPGGIALRFARVKRYRPDKSAAHADTLATLKQTGEPQRHF